MEGVRYKGGLQTGGGPGSMTRQVASHGKWPVYTTRQVASHRNCQCCHRHSHS